MIERLLQVFREESDAAGTLGDWIGDRSIQQTITTSASGRKIMIQTPPLPPDATGRIFIHRVGEFAGSPWPAEGGAGTIDVSSLPVMARTTIVAAAISRRGLELKYSNVFIEYE